MLRQLSRIDSLIGLIVEDGAKTVLLVFLAVSTLICLVFQSLALAHRYPLDYGEAPLVDQAIRLAAGQNIYRADLSGPPYTISNYPPVYVAVLAIGVRLFGPSSSFFVGRLISVLSAWASCVFLGLIVYASTRDRLAGLSTGLIFLAFPFVVFWSSLLRIDFLALALSLAGLCLLAWWPVSPRRLVAAALLLVAASYTRQSYALAAPFGAFVWLLARDWRRALSLAALVGGVGLTLFLLLNALTDGGFYFNIVTANVNEFRADILERNLYHLYDAAWLFLYLGGASLLLIRRWNPLYALAAPYVVGAALSALTIGKIGSNVNYFLELCAALSLAAGVFIVWSRKHLSIHLLRAALPGLLVVQVGQLLPLTFKDYVRELTARRALTNELRQLEELVAGADGPVLADEYMGLITLQGHPLYLQPFEATQLARAGDWDQTPLLESLHNQEFPLILIYDRSWYTERWTKEMLTAIQRDYRLTESLADTKVYRPIGAQSAAPAETCSGAPWRLPTDGVLGVQWHAGNLLFFGKGNEGAVPVFAVADGLLTRLPDWVDAVAIQHADPLHAGHLVWSYYAGLLSANGIDSHIATEFPPGSEGIPVRAGQIIGYQGSWSGQPQWPAWIHVRFAVVQAAEQKTFPAPLTRESILDPAPYLGLSQPAQLEKPDPQPLHCANAP